MERRDIRDQLVIATKYTTNSQRGRADIEQQTSYVGNNMKNMHISDEESLKKLRTSYIDILYLHWWDYTTPIRESAHNNQIGRVLLSTEWERTEQERKVAKVLEEVAAEVHAPNIQAVAIAYVMQKTPYVFPIIGGRKVEHLHANIEALDVALSEAHIQKIESAVPFDKGTMYNLFGDGSSYGFFHQQAGHFDRWPVAQAIRPH